MNEARLSLGNELIADLLAHSRTVSRVYHYTSTEGLLGIVSSASIYATDIRFLNDRVELTYALRQAELAIARWAGREERKNQERFVSALTRALTLTETVRHFVVSFSELGDSLAQWRGYAGDNGYAIGWHANVLQDHIAALTGRWAWVKCVYDLGQQEKILDDVIGRLYSAWRASSGGGAGLLSYEVAWYSFVVFAAAAFKHPSFSEEQEWRLVLQDMPSDEQDQASIEHRVGNGGPVPFVALPLPRPSLGLAEVVAGPDESDLRVRGASSFLASAGHSNVLVRPSAVPYRAG